MLKAHLQTNLLLSHRAANLGKTTGKNGEKKKLSAKINLKITEQKY